MPKKVVSRIIDSSNPVICKTQGPIIIDEQTIAANSHSDKAQQYLRRHKQVADRSADVGQMQQLGSSEGVVSLQSYQHAVTISNSFIGIFGAIYAAHRAWANYNYIVNSYGVFIDEINNAPSDEILKLLEIKEAYNIEEALELYSQKKMLNHITENTISPGIAGTSTVIAILVSFSIVFPPVALPLFAGAVIAGAIGLAATSYATYKNRELLKRKLDGFKKNEKIQKILKEKADKFSKTPKFDKAVKKAKLMDKSLKRSLDFYLVLFATSSFGFLSKIFSIASTVAQNIALIAITTFDAAVNYFQRQKKLHKFEQILREALVPRINEKKYVFFGKSIFTNYVVKNSKQIEGKYNINLGKTPLEAIKQLRYDNPDLFNKIENDCVQNHLKNKFSGFCKNKNLDEDEQNFALFAQNEIAKTIKADVRKAGISGTAGIGIGLVFLSLTFPPLFVAALTVASATILIGPVVTEFIAEKEKNKFIKKCAKISEQATAETKMLPADVVLYKKLLSSAIPSQTLDVEENTAASSTTSFRDRVTESRSKAPKRAR